MPGISGLSNEHRIEARTLAVRAAMLGYNNRDLMHYSQGPRRFEWTETRQNLKAFRGEFPKYTDCSGFVTWCIWNGLDHFGVRDTVNHLRWLAGFTGTMVDHGIVVKHPANYLRADVALYGNPDGRSGHTAIIVGRHSKTKRPMVVSFGSERGPLYLDLHYRSDLHSVHRYI